MPPSTAASKQPVFFPWNMKVLHGTQINIHENTCKKQAFPNYSPLAEKNTVGVAREEGGVAYGLNLWVV